MSKLKVMTWNIHGGVIDDKDYNTENLVKYLTEDTNKFARILKRIDSDIVCLQETHLIKNKYSQGKELATCLNYPYYCDFQLDNSHILPNSNYGIGLSIISRYQLFDIDRVWLPNPNISKKQSNGEIWKTHDKGVLQAKVRLENEKEISILCLHLLPLHRFDVSSEEPVIKENWQKIDDLLFNICDENTIILGDFNQNTLTKFLPKTFNKSGMVDIEFTKNTHRNTKFDHVIVGDSFKILTFDVLDDYSLSDHFPCVAEINID